MHGEICKCLFYFHLLKSSFCFSQTPQHSVLQHPTSVVHPQEAPTASKQRGASTGSSQGAKRLRGQAGCGHRAVPGAIPELLSCPIGQTQAVLWALGACDQHPLLARRQVRGEHRRGRLQVTMAGTGAVTHRQGHSHTNVTHTDIPHTLHVHSVHTQQTWIQSTHRDTQRYTMQTLPTEQTHSTHTHYTDTQTVHTMHTCTVHTQCSHCRHAHTLHIH